MASYQNWNFQQRTKHNITQDTTSVCTIASTTGVYNREPRRI